MCVCVCVCKKRVRLCTGIEGGEDHGSEGMFGWYATRPASPAPASSAPNTLRSLLTSSPSCDRSPHATLQEGINRYVLGEGLNPLEQEWLAQIINEHIGELASGASSTSSERTLPAHVLVCCIATHAYVGAACPTNPVPPPEENRGRLRELGEFAGGAAERALPAGSTASGSGQRYPDWAAKEGAAAARQAELAAAKAGSAARRAGERAAADARRRGAEVERSAGSFRAAAWERKKQQQKQRSNWDSDDDDDGFFML